MHNNQNIARNALPTPGPAQKPTEFAAAILRQSYELNDRLTNLRYRFFGDQESGAPRDEPKEMSLEAHLQAVHFQLNEALSQLDAVQNRM